VESVTGLFAGLAFNFPFGLPILSNSLRYEIFAPVRVVTSPVPVAVLVPIKSRF